MSMTGVAAMAPNPHKRNLRWGPFGVAVEVLRVTQLRGQSGAPKMVIPFAAHDSVSLAGKERKND